jgi:hypothetical protein
LNDSANLSIVDLASEKTVAAVRVPTEARDFFFADEDSIRIYRSYFSASWASAIPLLEFRIPEKKLERTGEVPVGPGGRLEIRYEPGGVRLFALEDQGEKLTLRDGRTGTLLSTLSEGSRLADFARISDAAVVALGFDGGGLFLKRISLDGKILGTVSLGIGSAARLTGMSSDGHFLVNVCRSMNRVYESRSKGWSLLTIDADSDRILSETPGLAPLSIWSRYAAPEPTGMRRSAPETKYFVDENGALVFFDAATGERKQILPKPR